MEAPWFTISEAQAFPRIVDSVVDIGAFERALATTTIVSSSLNPAVVGQTVDFTVTVSPAKSNAIVPTGTVMFFNGPTVLALNVPLVNGTATFSTSTLPLGSASISAVYSGDLNFANSTSTPLTQTVNLAPTVPVSLAAVVTSTAPAPVASAIPSVAITSAVVAEHHGKVAKKAAAPKKAHPTGGSSTKFHQTKHTAVLKRSVAVIAKHAKVKVKKK